MKRLFELINRNLFIDKIRELTSSNKNEKQLPLITISREMGSGGRPIAFLIVKKLGKKWKVYHKEIVEELARQTHLEKKLIKEVDEANISLIDEVIADFFGKRYLNLSSYYKQLVKILTTIGHRGYAVIVGRGAHYLFPHALKIRIICDMNQRIKSMMQYEKLTKNQAILRIEKSDKERGDFEKTIYNHDWRKAYHYDLILRTGPDFSIETASNLIIHLAKKRFKI